MAPLHLGNNNPQKLYLGQDEVQKLYLGDKQVWEAASQDVLPGSQALSIRLSKPRVTAMVAPEPIFLEAIPSHFTLPTPKNAYQDVAYTHIYYEWTVDRYIGETPKNIPPTESHMNDKSRYRGQKIALVLEYGGTYNITCKATNMTNWSEVAFDTFQISTADPDTFFSTAPNKRFLVASDGVFEDDNGNHIPNDGEFTSIISALKSLNALGRDSGGFCRISLKCGDSWDMSKVDWQNRCPLAKNFYLDYFLGNKGTARPHVKTLEMYGTYGTSVSWPDGENVGFIVHGIEVGSTDNYGALDPLATNDGGDFQFELGTVHNQTLAAVDCRVAGGMDGFRGDGDQINWIVWDTILEDNFLYNGLCGQHHGIDAWVWTVNRLSPEAPQTYVNNLGYICGWGVRSGGVPAEYGHQYVWGTWSSNWRSWSPDGAIQANWRLQTHSYIGSYGYFGNNYMDGSLTTGPTSVDSSMVNFVVEGNRAINHADNGAEYTGLNPGAVVYNNIAVRVAGITRDRRQFVELTMVNRDDRVPEAGETETIVALNSPSYIFGNTCISLLARGDARVVGGGGKVYGDNPPQYFLDAVHDIRQAANLLYAPYQDGYYREPETTYAPINLNQKDGLNPKYRGLWVDGKPWQPLPTNLPHYIIRTTAGDNFDDGETITWDGGSAKIVFPGVVFTVISNLQGNLAKGVVVTGAQSGHVEIVQSAEEEFVGAMATGMPRWHFQTTGAGNFIHGEVINNGKGASAIYFKSDSAGRFFVSETTGGSFSSGDTVAGTISGATAFVTEDMYYAGGYFDATPLPGSAAINAADWSAVGMQPPKDFYGNNRVQGMGTIGAIEAG